MLTLLIIAVTAGLSWAAFGRPRLLARLMLWPPAVSRGRQYDRLLGYGFVHADTMHLLFNMVTLFFFGRAIETALMQRFGLLPGALMFVLFYLSALLMAGLPSYLKHSDDASYRTLGASGAVSAVLFAFIMFAPLAKIIVFPIPVGIPAIVYAVLYVGYSVWMEKRGGDNVNHSAHLFGAAYGVLFVLFTHPGQAGRFLEQLGG